MSLGVAKHLQFIYSIHLLEDESFLLLCPSLPLPAPCPHPLELATWQKITEVLFWKYFARQMTCLPRCKASVTTPGRQTNSPTSSMLFWFLESLNLQMGETHLDLHRWNESISWNHSSQDSQRVLQEASEFDTVSPQTYAPSNILMSVLKVFCTKMKEKETVERSICFKL